MASKDEKKKIVPLHPAIKGFSGETHFATTRGLSRAEAPCRRYQTFTDEAAMGGFGPLTLLRCSIGAQPRCRRLCHP